jgi:hypothetical protein
MTDAEIVAKKTYEKHIKPWNKPVLSKYAVQYNKTKKQPRWEKVRATEIQLQLEADNHSQSSSQGWNVTAALPGRASKRHSIIQKMMNSTTRKNGPLK